MCTTPNINEELRRLDDAVNNKLIPSFTVSKTTYLLLLFLTNNMLYEFRKIGTEI